VNPGKNKMTAIVASTVALFVLAILLLIRISGRTGITDPHVRIETRPQNVRAAADMRRQNLYKSVERVMNGEVSNTASRVQEAMMIATASALMLAGELTNSRAPQSSDQLIDALSTRQLLPTGIVREGAPGTLKSPHATIVVRYRPSPLTIEVVSIGNGEMPGPAILIRVPKDEGTSDSGLWMAETNEIIIPRPFAPPAELIAQGYVPDMLPNLK
jgi:hypothetical protein